MKLIESKLRQVKRILAFTSLLYSVINTLVAFMIFLLILKFFTLPLIYSIVPTGAYFVYAISKKNKKIGFSHVEKKIPTLEWKLRTSADNVDRDDEVVEGLHRDVMDQIRLVSVSKFLTNKDTVFKFATVVCLSLLFVVISAKNVNFGELKPEITGNAVKEFFDKDNFDLGRFFVDDEEGEGDIYGENSVAKYGNKEELLKLNQVGGVVDPSKIGNGEGKEFGDKSFNTGDKEAVGGDTSKEKIREEDKEIIMNYFKKINKE